MNVANQSELTDYVAGFFDAEGCVQSHISENDQKRIGYQYQPKAVITQSYAGGFFDGEGSLGFNIRSEDEANVGHVGYPRAVIVHRENDELLDSLCQFGDRIGISYNTRIEEKENHWADVFRWGVHRTEDVEKFLSVIRDSCVVKRVQIDIMLQEIIPRVKSKDNLNRRGFLGLVAWNDALNSYKGGLRGKYNLGYFEDLWGMELEADRLPDAHPRNAGTEEVA